MSKRRVENLIPTGRERVRACLGYERLDRVPRDLWTLPYMSLFHGDEIDDLLRDYPPDIGRAELAPGDRERANLRIARTGSYIDDWGSLWEVGEPGVIGEVKRPALADWSDLDRYHPPWDLIRDRDFSYANRMCAEDDRFMISPCTARPFERLQFLRGSENLFLDLGYGTHRLLKLMEMIHEFYLEDIRGWCRSDVDAVFFMDDWGTNLALLINPETWRELFKPLYKDYCDLIHGAGKSAFFHSDGHIEAILEDLIEIGIDAVNAQLFCMDIEEIGLKFKGRLTFWGEIDRQRLLPFGTPDEVREAVFRVRRALDGESGGVIAQCEWGKNNPAANIRAVFESWNLPSPALT